MPKNTKWTKSKIIHKINNYHKFHCQSNAKDDIWNPYRFNIESVLDYADDIKGDNVNIQKIIEILNQMYIELLEPNKPVKWNAEFILQNYLVLILDTCLVTAVEGELFDYLMDMIFICSHCGNNDEFGGVFKCNGCEREYCHECVNDALEEDSKFCIYCAPKNTIL